MAVHTFQVASYRIKNNKKLKKEFQRSVIKVWMQLQGALNPNNIQQRNQSTANPAFLSTENPNKNQISLHNTNLTSNKKYFQDILLYEKYEKN